MKKTGYTIAEALITMAIIGVVASLIMPTFIAKYRKNVYASRLSSAVTNFENAMTVLIMKGGVDDLLGTEAWKAIKSGSSYSLTNSSSRGIILSFMSKIGNVLPINSYDTTEPGYYKTLQNTSYTLGVKPVRFQIKNGAEYMICVSDVNKSLALSELSTLNSGVNYSNKAAIVYIDFNGDTPPNIIGRDLFRYDLGTDGRLYPYGGKDWAIYHNETYNSPETKCKTDKDGDYCAAYLMDNNYKMDY